MNGDLNSNLNYTPGRVSSLATITSLLTVLHGGRNPLSSSSFGGYSFNHSSSALSTTTSTLSSSSAYNTNSTPADELLHTSVTALPLFSIILIIKSIPVSA
jgi:hypothetical protein